MRKAFTIMAALALALAVDAQTATGPGTRSAALHRAAGAGVSELASTGAKAPQRKITVDEGERIMGFYSTDDLPDLSRGAYIGLTYTGTWKVAALFDGNVIGNFVGGDIVRMRFALAKAIRISRAFIYTGWVDSSGNVEEGETLAEVTFGLASSTSVGWNDVELPEPIRIEEGTQYLIGYEYEQVDGESPLVTDEALAVDYTSDYGFLGYGQMYSYLAAIWNQFTGAGALCVQAVVRGGNFIDDDVALDGLSVTRYVAKAGEVECSFKVKNWGNVPPDSYTLKVAIDGNEVETIDTPVALTSSYQTVSRTLGVDGLSAGEHSVSVSVETINGATPVGNTDDDLVEATFMIYEGEAVERQMHLIENFTSIYCGYCPLGTAVLDIMQERNPGKYAWVAMHGIHMGDDPYALYPESLYAIESFSEMPGYPSAAFSRALLTDDLLDARDDMALGIGYYEQYQEMAAEAIDAAVDTAFGDVPAFVSVDIATDYDEQARELTVTVSGSGVGNAREILGDNRLTVYLTEDGITGQQMDYDNGDPRNDHMMRLTHNNVLRAIASEYEWGDDINWTSDGSYENTVKVTLDGEWNVESMHVVAFISGPMEVLQDGEWVYGDKANALVNNANCVKATEGESGISLVAAGEDGGARTYYSIDGRMVSAPVKGINIVRSSDGTARKVVVR